MWLLYLQCMLGVLYVASLFEHPVQSLYVLIRHYKALCRVYHSNLVNKPNLVHNFS